MVHADANTVYTPGVDYEPCCGPLNFATGTVFRDSFESAKAQELSAWAAADAQRRAAVEAENAAQEARIRSMTDGNS